MFNEKHKQQKKETMGADRLIEKCRTEYGERPEGRFLTAEVRGQM